MKDVNISSQEMIDARKLKYRPCVQSGVVEYGIYAVYQEISREIKRDRERDREIERDRERDR